MIRDTDHGNLLSIKAWEFLLKQQ